MREKSTHRFPFQLSWRGDSIALVDTRQSWDAVVARYGYADMHRAQYERDEANRLHRAEHGLD